MPARPSPAALALALALLAGGCAPGSYYAWGSYNEVLYAHYRAPQAREAWIAGLETTIRAAEQEGLRMPPGIYAEYGYALFEEGRTAEAIAYFEKEKALWPEARFFMDKMIRNAGQRGPQPAPAAQGPAGALEKERKP
jgi:hypothetical protein